MINYKEPIRKPLVDQASNEICKWVFGLEGTCSESGESGYIDAVWDVSDLPKKHYELWTKSEIDTEYEKCSAENKFTGIIEKKIGCKNNKKVQAKDFDYNSAPTNI